MGLRRGKLWKIREDLRPLLVRAKKLFPTLLGHVETKRILLCSYYSRSAKKIAYISSNRPPWSLFAEGYDYAVAFWASRFDSMKQADQIYVTVHELMHIPKLGHKTGKYYRKLVHHTIEDFELMLRAYGVSREDVANILKGEDYLFEKIGGKPLRFPRMQRLG
jgi:predicted metallopeptidase